MRLRYLKGDHPLPVSRFGTQPPSRLSESTLRMARVPRVRGQCRPLTIATFAIEVLEPVRFRDRRCSGGRSTCGLP